MLAEIPATATSFAKVVVAVVPEFPVAFEPVLLEVTSRTPEVAAPEYSTKVRVALAEGLIPQDEDPD